MAYEVWIFQDDEGDTEQPSRLVSVATPPPSYSKVDVYAWARGVERAYAKETGALVRAHVREEASY